MFRSAVITLLVASLCFSQPLSTLALEDKWAPDYEELTEADSIDEPLSEINISAGAENLSDNILKPTGKGNVNKIGNPRISEGVTTWDCVYFGNFWQNKDTDRNGIVDDKDQKEKNIWRVLHIDTEGNALLLSDKILYTNSHRDYRYASSTWETCSLRSMLNCYGESMNDSKRDFTDRGFLKNAFTAKEIDAITTTYVINLENPVTHTDGGNNTKDKIFLLSTEEVMNEQYGFVKNDFSCWEVKNKYYATEDDPTRVANATLFEDTCPPYGKPDGWWLRSPGSDKKSSAVVSDTGYVHVGGHYCCGNIYGTRPALCIVYYMITTAFFHHFSFDPKNKTLGRIDSRDWDNKFKKNMKKWYLYQILTGFWNQNRQVSDLNSLLHESNDIDYSASISRKRWAEALNNYFDTNRDNYTTRNVPSESRLIMNYLYRMMIQEDANRANYFKRNTDDGETIEFDIEHIVPVSKFDKFASEHSISAIGNLCYLPIKDNRSKRDHTIYEYAMDRPSLTFNENFLEMIDYPKREDLAFIDCPEDQFSD